MTPKLHVHLGSSGQSDDSPIPERLSYTEGLLFIQRETRNALEKEQDHHQGNIKDASVPNKLVHSVSLSWFILFYSFIYGCAGSALLFTGFLQLQQAGVMLRCRAQASHHSGFSCYGARVLNRGLQ